MSAARHAQDALYEGRRLGVDIEALIAGDQPVTPEQLEHLRRQVCMVNYHAARATHDLKLIPQDERRDQAGARITFQPELSAAPRVRLPVLTDRIELGARS